MRLHGKNMKKVLFSTLPRNLTFFNFLHMSVACFRTQTTKVFMAKRLTTGVQSLFNSESIAKLNDIELPISILRVLVQYSG